MVLTKLIGLFIILSFTFVSADVEVGFGQGQGQLGVNIILPDAPVNVSSQTVNHSDTTDTILTNIGAISNFNNTQFDNNAGTLTIDPTWLQAVINFFVELFVSNFHDQDLNTTSNVTFNNLSVTQNLSIGTMKFYQNDTFSFIQF